MSDHLTLRSLRLGDETAFYIAVQEFKTSGDFDFVSHYKEGMPFSDLLALLEDQEKGRSLPDGFVPSTLLFAFVGSKLVGRVTVRHKLNDFLRRVGGHIGYGVVPSERRKGLASQMLQKSLPIAMNLGLDKVLVTCDDTNLASRKIIENAGGKFERLSPQGKGSPDKRLYWISLTESSSEEELRRVVIIGASGSGKTTLGRFLSSKWNLPICDLDDVFWLPEWIMRDRAEERVDVERVVAQEKWIIIGNYSRYRDITWYNADLIIWLDLPLLTCLWRGLRRSIRHIWHHEPLCNGNYDSWRRLLSFDTRSILYWILTTHKEKRERYVKLLENEKDQKLPKHARLRSHRDVSDFMDKVEN